MIKTEKTRGYILDLMLDEVYNNLDQEMDSIYLLGKILDVLEDELEIEWECDLQ